MRKLTIILFLSVMSLPTKYVLAKFETGDRVILIGDSITDSGSYHGNIYLYYATRFPEASFSIFNCGTSGDTAPGANRRFDSDIAIHKPNVATVMLGMNDAWASCFSPEKTEASQRQEREKIYSTYTSEIKKLAASLQTIGCRIIFITPSIYDQTADLESINHMGKNDMLCRFAAYINKLAIEYNAEVVDLHSLMLSINARLQTENPSATVVGPDRVHPGMPGHFLMCYAFLEAQNAAQFVSSIKINARAGTIEAADNCSIKPAAEISSEGLSFYCLENALPYPVKDAEKPALDWVPFQKKYNQQILKVTQLDKGNYELRIDGVAVGIWPADELEAGINLSGIQQTPQYQQALAVMAANDERMKTAAVIRSIVHVRHSMFHHLDSSIDTANLSMLEDALHEHVTTSIEERWHGYFLSQIEKYMENAPKEAALRVREISQMQKIWTLNKPRAHHWELARKD